MRKMWKKALASFLTLAMVASSFSGFAAEVQAAETGKVEATVQGDSVVIGNDYISREFSTAGDKLSTVKITNKRTDNDDAVFTPAEGSEEFIIKVCKDAEASAPVQLAALDRTGWTAVADSYHNASGPSDGPASNLLDGNVESIWHTNYGGGTGDQAYPYNVVITLNGEKTFKCFSYTPRSQGEATNGNVRGYELWASMAADTLAVDAEGWTKIAEGNFEYNGVNPIYVNLAEECTATQLKFVATSSNNGAAFAGGAEFNLHADAAPVDTNTRSFAASALELAGDPVVEDTTATINNVEKTGKKITFSFKPYEYKDAEWTIKEVVVMYDGDHYMRKFMEIELDNKDLAIDYIDLESFNVEGVPAEAQWTIPNVGGIVQMEAFKANLGQPIYIDGMFFGSEFPETDTQIVDETGYIRYYTGKTFNQFKDGNQLTTDGKYVTWQTVAGAARSATDLQVIQADFFEYIYDIATPSDFRIQYNSWFDNMMLISDESILKSFIEMDRELNEAEVRPLDSYVVDDGWINYNDTYEVDVARAGTGLNTEGFWAFNSKFPEGLKPSSDLVHKFGSNFGVWVGPRGGYNFYGHLANIIQKAGNGSKAGGSIDVADSIYHDNLTELFVNWQKDYGVNYWKWDGFADEAQYNTFTAQDGVPGYQNHHMTGGYKGMYHVTDLWEGWIDIFEAVRQSEKDHNINKLWLSLTCYTNPSPWFLQWANSVWMQCTHDQNDSGFSSSKMDRQLTYRDACYYEFINNHQFQFPLANVYNHDPVYGVEGTEMNKNTATDEQFQNYLYAQSARGTAFWELYFSDSIMTGDKYEITAEFLAWAEENHRMLKNAKMFGGHPSNNVRLSNGGAAYQGAQDAYGFAGFDGYDGIITIRNSAADKNDQYGNLTESGARTVTLTFDRTIGVPEDAGTLKYHLEHTHNLTADTPTTGEFTYGESYTFTLQPDEVRMFRVSKDGDQTAPEFMRAFSDGDKVVTVKFNEKVSGSVFTVSGAEIESVEKSADDVTYYITLTEALADNAVVEIAATDIKDLAGNACTDTISFVHNTGNIVAAGNAAAADSLSGSNGFTVAATVETATAGTVVAQGDAYALAINEEGKATFTLNGTTAVSDVTVADGDTIVGVKENNGILKLYVAGTLAGSAYNAENRFYNVAKADITVNNVSKAIILDTAYGYDLVQDVYDEAGMAEDLQIPSTSMTGTGSSTDTTEPAHDKSAGNAVDGDENTFWATEPNGTLENAYYIVELDNVYKINQVNYTKRYDSSSGYNCTGNLLDYVISVSTDGEHWTQVAAGDTVDGTTVITFDEVDARYVKLTATESHHWQDGTGGQPDNRNTVMTVAELAVYKVPTPKSEEIKAVGVTAGNSELDYATETEGPAEYAYDGDELTHWHTKWYPTDGNTHEDHWVQLELDAVYAVDTFTYLPRQDSSPNGRIKGYEILVSLDGKTWDTAATGEWDTSTNLKEVKFEEAKNAKYVRLQVVSATSDQDTDGNGRKFASAAEIGVKGIKTDIEVPTPTPVDKAVLQSAVNNAKNQDYSNYTDESVAALQKAIADAEAVLADGNATQEAVDAAKDALATAIEGLKEKTEPPLEEDGKVTRLYGGTRFATGFAAAEEYKKLLGVEQFEAVVVATGYSPADALSGSYLAVQNEAPILLADPNNVDTLVDYVKANLVKDGKVYILGGTGAVPADVEEKLADHTDDICRLKGNDRFGTNLEILAEVNIEGAAELLVATGWNYADSLSASAVNKPILLVEKVLTDGQKEVLEALGEDAKIYILGGDAAVSEDIAAELAAYGTVERVKGADRFGTSVEIAKKFFGEDVEAVTFAYGWNYPDGLCGGPVAAAADAPVLLVHKGATDEAAEYAAGVEAGYIFGGSGAVADETVKAVLGDEIQIVEAKYE